MGQVGIDARKPSPEVLARELHTTGRCVRGFLRERFPRPATELGARWALTEEQVAEVRRRLSGVSGGRLTRSATTATRQRRTETGTSPVRPYRKEWYWEGNVQATVRRYLESEGWMIVSEANSATKEAGDDICAARNGRTLVVEVKGYPSAGYADPRRVGEVKPTNPTSQAKHWFAEALLRSLRTIGTRRDVLVMMAFPAKPRYQSLLIETGLVLKRLGITVFFVQDDGSVTEPLGKGGRRKP